jgi:hypothetical protein
MYSRTYELGCQGGISELRAIVRTLFEESAKNRLSGCFSPLNLFFDILLPSPVGISTKRVFFARERGGGEGRKNFNRPEAAEVF